jgi:hypothetical protein
MTPCKCGHAAVKHPVDLAGHCMVAGCGCYKYRPVK